MGILLSVGAAPFVIVFCLWAAYKLNGSSWTRFLITGEYAFMVWLVFAIIAFTVLVLFYSAAQTPVDYSLNN